MVYNCVITTTEQNEKIIWDFLLAHIKNEYGVAGLIGNLFGESTLRPENLENIYEKRWKTSDAAYTDAINNGTYTREQFKNDKGGYGIAQWTFWSRKEGLYDYAKQLGVLINDLNMQLNYLWIELTTKYTTTLDVLYNAKSVKEASDEVLVHFEHPGAVDDPNKVDKVKATRYSYSMNYYDKFATGSEPTGIYMYDGVNYAPVFDPTFYSNRYNDLKKAFGTDATALFNHFTRYGMKEARQASKDFNPKTYRSRYNDLNKAFGNNWPEYYKHYCVYGKAEGRIGS